MNLRTRFFALILLFACIFSFASCGKGLSVKDAKADAARFFSDLENGDYEGAAARMHPSRKIGAEALEARMTAIGIDPAVGIERIRYSSVSASYYDTEVGGSSVELEMQVLFEGASAEIEFELTFVKNDAGYGIYELEIDD